MNDVVEYMTKAEARQKIRGIIRWWLDTDTTGSREIAQQASTAICAILRVAGYTDKAGQRLITRELDKAVRERQVVTR